jgi:hypothetical protein
MQADQADEPDEGTARRLSAYPTADERLKLVDEDSDADAWLRGDSVDLEGWR